MAAAARARPTGKTKKAKFRLCPHHTPEIDSACGIFRACQVAEGSADLSIVIPRNRQGRTYWWDVAAGHAIVLAAGGVVETFDGSELIYDAADLQVGPHVLRRPVS